MKKPGTRYRIPDFYLSVTRTANYGGTQFLNVLRIKLLLLTTNLTV